MSRESMQGEIARLQALVNAAAIERAASETERDRLTFELGHRVKNVLSVVQALAGQTLRGADTKEEALATFGARIIALARANDVILNEGWTTVTLRAVAERVLQPFDTENRRLTIDGPELRIGASAALSLAMALYELASNAKRHGAWSVEAGRVDLSWWLDATVQDQSFTLTWRESDGLAVEPPAKRRFGLRLIEQSMQSAFGRDVAVMFEPQGLQCRVRASLSRLAESA
ncbi:hypothetical protein LGH83_01305 [Lichenihabitans sp. PAMC28606]|uniref:HWE histidine kinase domain-containing protein n=1 Tax=Lichenihabitans sp. PAMC28606 TaxID=2880932 RepID=UPI001D0B01B1|nr:HWE histidine kinase domain-containing protein [Lichenihabitans sp. PAMC28606]UDL94941.1 hypothetical protein LGH83_01305 [Lichenihabitans sp. PAMC28606]